VWLERQGVSGYKKRLITSAPKSMYRSAVLCDINGDSIIDIIAAAEIKGAFDDGESALHIFYGNKSENRFEKKPVVAGKGAGGFPCAFDIDGDGDLDIASAEFYGASGSFSWFENPGATGQWVRHAIDETAGKAFQLAVIPNLFGAGTITAVGTNHTNIYDDPYDRESALFVYEKPLNPRFSWPRIKVSSDFRPRQTEADSIVKQKAPGAFACANIDGDRDLDIVVNGAGDPNVYLFTQVKPKKFEMSVLAVEMPHGGVAAADYDGDAVGDIVLSSAENNRLLIFKNNSAGQHPGF
ncbi:MAG TPA: VCBS repeat-containing protein, partial [Candidatus Wallbacteria bacterium]|nr:VCBS repeat-containing protein [Candidatus Wallbacteria bacterium]